MMRKETEEEDEDGEKGGEGRGEMRRTTTAQEKNKDDAEQYVENE